MKKKMDPRNRVIRPIITVLSAVILVVGVYYFVSSKGRIPSLPRVHLTADDQNQAIEELLSRIKDYEPNPEEKELALLLTRIHRLETTQKDDGAKLPEVLKLFNEAASDVIRRDKKRYLLLGDFLASEFAKSFENLLSLARREGFSRMSARDNKKIEEIKIKGGSFLTHARRRGVIGDKGQLHVPRITPQVLFRIRWRHMGGLPIDEELNSQEKRAYFDFVVAFTDPLSIKRRLGAIKRLKETDNSYDDLIARAIVLHESGSDQNAYRELKTAIDQGRTDAEILDFAKALR
jgi:hypothetical protein